MKRKLPGHLSGSIREWRIIKRGELDIALYYLKRVAFGAAYTPRFVKPDRTLVSLFLLLQDLRDLRQAWSQKEWGK